MKDRIVLACICFSCILLVSSCSEDQAVSPEILSQSEIATLSLYPSMKGWELYTWEEKGEWNFSLMEGSNTLKNYGAVVANSVVVQGLFNFEGVLKKLPAGEDIALMSETWLEQIWMTPYQNLSLPSDDIIASLSQICEENKLKFTLAE